MLQSQENTQTDIKQDGHDEDDFLSEETLDEHSQIPAFNLLPEVNKVFHIDSDKSGDPGSSKKEIKPVGSEESDYYILILDPESQIYYRKIIGRDDFIRIEPLDDQMQRAKSGFTSENNSASQTPISNANGQVMTIFEDDRVTLKKQIQENNIKTLVKMTQMLLLPNFSWTFVGEADTYRRRPFPLKFLQYECSDFPCYVFTSELSKAFNDINEIQTIVDLSEYSEKISIRDKSQSAPYVYSEKESLVTSTQEFIKNILRQIFKKYRKTRIQPMDGHDLTLKVDGYREYLMGNYQLLQYERVRYCLRKKLPLKLILTEINTNHRDVYFPPLFKMDKCIMYPIKHVKAYQLQMTLKTLQDWQEKKARQALEEKENKDQKNNAARGSRNPTQKRQSGPKQKRGEGGSIEVDEQPPDTYRMSQNEVQQILENHKYNRQDDLIDFEEIADSSQFFWYSPVPNIQEKENLLNSQKSQLLQSHLGGAEKGGSLSSSNGLSKRDMIEMNFVEVPEEKQQISISRHRFSNGGTTQSKSHEQIVVDSGEVNMRFRLKLVSLERINKIFEEVRTQVATDNLETEPRNVTLNPDKVVNKQGKKDKKKDKKDESHKGENETGIEEVMNTMLRSTGLSGEDISNGSDPQAGEDNKTSKHGQKSSHQKQDDTADVPKLLKASLNIQAKKEQNEMKMRAKDQEFQEEQEWQAKIRDTFQQKNFKKILKKKFKEGKVECKYKFEEGVLERFDDYKEDQFKKIQQPFCNFSESYSTVAAYKNILRFSIGNYTPYKIKVEMDLYHGCEKLVETQVVEEVFFTNNINFDKWTNFGDLRYCQLPVKTRLSVNVILIFQNCYELTIGCVSMNLFNEKRRFMSGVQDLNIWPFYEIDERLGCMKEYKGRQYNPSENREDVIQNIHNEFTKLVIKLEEFTFPMYYSSRDIGQIKEWGLILNKDDLADERDMLSNETESLNKDLAQLKKCFAKNPLSPLSKEEKKVLFKTREHFSTYPQGLPIFLRSVQWDRPLLVNETYKMLRNWAPMEPDEAIQLLDAKFPDERVRSYAVQRINHLSDDDFALFMLQFSQALLYEEQHYSPLSDMLIERSLKNPYVVGQAFYWALKGNLYLKPSYERYYLLLEQFLMLCGKFRNQLQVQMKVNSCLQKVSENVMKNRYGLLEVKEHPWQINTEMMLGSGKKEKKKKKAKKKGKKGENQFDIIKKEAKLDLLKQKQNDFPFLFNLTIDPKSIIKDFVYESISVFKSKKVPILLTMMNAQPGGQNTRALFKNGDDLRQDILTLQIISVIDKIWLDHNLDLKMTPYKVIGTHCMQGFLEFVPNAVTLAYMQYQGSLKFVSDECNIFNTFKNDTVTKYLTNKTRKRMEELLAKQEKENNFVLDEKDREQRLNQMTAEELQKIREVFAKSTAGYCVASYILGLGDRHPDNIMINEIEGNFLHIDFGHFLGNVKQKFGIKRERDPFVFTPEVAEFINGGPFRQKWYKRVLPSRRRASTAASKKIEKQSTLQSDQMDSSPGKRPIYTTMQTRNNLDMFEDEDYGSEGEDERDFELVNKPSEQEITYDEAASQRTSPATGIYKSKEFLQFEEDCCNAYNILRKQGNKLINLFLLMLSAGMPELNHQDDLEYLVKKLAFEQSEQEASKAFKKEIQRAIQSTSRRLDNFAHNLKACHM